jgi:hypothetical protein
MNIFCYYIILNHILNKMKAITVAGPLLLGMKRNQ